MKILNAMFAVAVPLLGSGVALAQSGHMMNGGMGGYGWTGGYSGVLLPILVVIAAVGLVTWFVKQQGK